MFEKFNNWYDELKEPWRFMVLLVWMITMIGLIFSNPFFPVVGFYAGLLMLILTLGIAASRS